MIIARVGSLSTLFFFSSRRRHTRLVSEWSSDVCSSDRDRKSVVEGKSGDLGGRRIIKKINLPTRHMTTDATVSRVRPFTRWRTTTNLVFAPEGWNGVNK